MGDLPQEQPGARSHLRIARPTRDMDRAETFWVSGVGLDVLWRSGPADVAEHRLLMLGWPRGAWHLELVDDPSVTPTPTGEDLLVLYVGRPIAEDVVQRLVGAGGLRVPSRNPYWDTWGITVEDPDGYRLVLSSREWGSRESSSREWGS